MFTSKEELIFIVVIISITFIVLCAFVIFVLHNYVKTRAEENANRLRAAFEAEENERTRIAGELHDSVGLKLSVLKLELEMIGQKHEGILNDEVPKILSETIQDVRTISRLQSSVFVSENGLSTELELLSRNLKRVKNIDCIVKVVCDFKKYNPEFTIHLYRIIQELVNNTIKHSAATSISINIIDNKNELKFSYADNGRGLSGKNNSGSGLKNIETRVNLWKGQNLEAEMKEMGFRYDCVFQHKYIV